MARQRSETSPAVWVATLMPCMAAGLVLAISWAVHWPLAELIAWVVVALGAFAFGVLAFIDGRATDRGFWGSLGHGVWTSIKALLYFLF